MSRRSTRRTLDPRRGCPAGGWVRTTPDRKRRLKEILMAKSNLQLSEVMTPNPVVLPAKATVLDAAREMQSSDIGDVLVLDGEQVCGIITDRDLVVRALAEELDPLNTRLADI